MSDLDDILDDIEEQNEQLAAMHLEEPVKRAREELELLREVSFKLIRRELQEVDSTTINRYPKFVKIIRSDPERSKRMGLEWIL